MGHLPTYFRDFLKDIRLTQAQIKDLKTGHTTLRKRLKEDEDIAPILVETFLQGSYRRHTAVRPNGNRRADVDVIVVTKLDREALTPEAALEKFRPFMKKHYKGKYRYQGRSICIELSYVELDLVPTSAPSEVDIKALQSESIWTTDSLVENDQTMDWRFNEFWISSGHRDGHHAQSYLYKAATQPEWKTEPLWIPDREAEEWQQTDPLAQIVWTRNKNLETNTHFVNVVKALKWWRLEKHRTPKHPKSYPLEHILGDCCPDGIESVAQGVTETLEAIRDNDEFTKAIDDEETPVLMDRAVDQDVFSRIAAEDFAAFHEQVSNAAELAREALDCENAADSAEKWREFFGDKFPKPPETSNKSNPGGYTERTQFSDTAGHGGRFA